MNAGGEGFYRVAYPPAWPARLVASGTLTPRERFVLVDDAWAAVVAGTHAGRGLPRVRADACATKTDVIVWRALVARLRNLTRLVDGTALGDAAVVRRRARATRLRRGSAGTLPPTKGRVTGNCAACCSTRSARSPTTTKSSRAPRSTAIDPTPTPTSSPRASPSPRATADADLFEEFARPVPRRRDAPGPAALPVRARAVPRRATRASAPARWPITDAVRTQNAPFLLQRALHDREHGPLVWEFVRDHWDDDRRAVPAHADRPDARRRHLARRRRVGADRARSSSRPTRSPKARA